MIISFETQDLQKVCLVLQVAEQLLGSVYAQALIATIADIEAFDNADQMLAFIGASAVSGEDDSLFLPIGASYRARFVATGTRFDRDASGRIIWSSVTRLKLIEVKDVDG